MYRWALFAFVLFSSTVHAETVSKACGGTGVWLQVLGSGGPEIDDQRASSSYLIWLDGRAVVMVDAGGGSAFNFERSGARFSDLHTILFSHFHVDHSADLPVYIKGSFFLDRHRNLPVYGPSGNALMPDTRQFVEYLLGTDHGAFHYLGNYLAPQGDEDYRVIPMAMDASRPQAPLADAVQAAYRDDLIETAAIAVHHGPVPALAWRVTIGGKRIAFSGDMNGDYHSLPVLAKGVDMLVAHNAIPQQADGVARNLHMPPMVTGEIAAQAGVGNLVLLHRMLRTLGREAETLREIRKRCKGPLGFADDLDCFPL